MSMTRLFSESGQRISFFRLLLYMVLILIFQQAMAGQLFSFTLHGTKAARHQDSFGGLRRPRLHWGTVKLPSAVLNPKTATGRALNAATAAFASTGLAMLTMAGIIALRRERTRCDLFSIEEMRRSYLYSALGGALCSLAIGVFGRLEFAGIDFGILVALIALALLGLSRSGIPADIESAKLEQLSSRLDELSRELTVLGRLSGRPNAAGEAL